MTTIPIDLNQVVEIVSVLFGIASPFAIVKKFKTKLNEFRDAVDDVDDAVNDPKIDEAQFTKIWNDFKLLTGHSVQTPQGIVKN